MQALLWSPDAAPFLSETTHSEKASAPSECISQKKPRPKSGWVTCQLCAHECHIAPQKRGLCAVRENRNGILHTLTADGVISAHPDPVEKKPLYHYHPGTQTFSIGTMGCNFRCAFCQNADISRHPARTGVVVAEPVRPDEIITAARRCLCTSVAFTYTEPTIFFELMAKTADLTLAAGLGTILVSNGFQSPHCLHALQHRIHAANIDLKSFSDAFYREYCGARLAPVLDNLKRMSDMGWWLEITTLLIPGLNDSPDEIHAIARFIHDALSPDVPWHISAFHPCDDMMDRPPTPASTILAACEIGRAEGLHFVYPGNVAHSAPTRCPSCNAIFIHRDFGRTTRKTAPGNLCATCGSPVPGIW